MVFPLEKFLTFLQHGLGFTIKPLVDQGNSIGQREECFILFIVEIVPNLLAFLELGQSKVLLALPDRHQPVGRQGKSACGP